MHEKQLCNQIQPKDFFRIVLMAETVRSGISRAIASILSLITTWLIEIFNRLISWLLICIMIHKVTLHVVAVLKDSFLSLKIFVFFFSIVLVAPIFTSMFQALLPKWCIINDVNSCSYYENILKKKNKNRKLKKKRKKTKNIWSALVRTKIQGIRLDLVYHYILGGQFV